MCVDIAWKMHLDAATVMHWDDRLDFSTCKSHRTCEMHLRVFVVSKLLWFDRLSQLHRSQCQNQWLVRWIHHWEMSMSLKVKVDCLESSRWASELSLNQQKVQLHWRFHSKQCRPYKCHSFPSIQWDSVLRLQVRANWSTWTSFVEDCGDIWRVRHLRRDLSPLGSPSERHEIGWGECGRLWWL